MLTLAGAWCPLLVGELLVQLFLAHLPDEHLEQAADHEQRVVGLPDEQLTAEEGETDSSVAQPSEKNDTTGTTNRNYNSPPGLECCTAASLWPAKPGFINDC